MPEKSGKLTEHEEELIAPGGEEKIKDNKDWAFIQDNASRLPTKKIPKVHAQRPSGGKPLPDVPVQDWTDH